MRIREWKWLQQDVVDHGKYHDVRGQAQRDDCQDRKGKALLPGQAAHRLAYVTNERISKRHRDPTTRNIWESFRICYLPLRSMLSAPFVSRISPRELELDLRIHVSPKRSQIVCYLEWTLIWSEDLDLHGDPASAQRESSFDSIEFLDSRTEDRRTFLCVAQPRA